MRGSLRELRRGVWELRVPLPVDPVLDKRRQRSVTFHGTKREALRELTRLVAESDRGAEHGSNVTLATLLDRWWKHKESRLALTTAREYRRLIENRIRPDLGSKKLQKLT